MPSPQTGIFALGTASHAYLEFDLLPSVEPGAVVARVSTLREPRTTIGGVNLVAGFRPELWAATAPDAAPSDVAGFNEAVVGPTGYTLPATQHDIVIWLTGATYDVVFNLSRQVAVSLAGQAVLAHEIVGWPYHHDLDLTGFIDGTENPTLVEATRVALVPPGSPGEGSSILLLQQWEHDAPSWEALPVAPRRQSSAGASPIASSSSPSPRRHTLHAPTRIGSAGSFAETSRTARSSVTARSSWASQGTSGFWRRCSTAWWAAAAVRPTSSRVSLGR
jgi:deferrochelatase/peroxidase EfeB